MGGAAGQLFTEVQGQVFHLVNTINGNYGDWHAAHVERGPQHDTGRHDIMIVHTSSDEKHMWLVHADGSASRPRHNPVKCDSVWSIVIAWLVPLGDGRAPALEAHACARQP